MTDTTDLDPADRERPAHAKSPLWDYRSEIEARLKGRRSYQQIATWLSGRGVTLSSSEVGKWCRRQGLRSVAASRHQASADKKPGQVERQQERQRPATSSMAAALAAAERGFPPSHPPAPAPAAGGSITSALDRLTKR